MSAQVVLRSTHMPCVPRRQSPNYQLENDLTWHLLCLVTGEGGLEIRGHGIGQTIFMDIHVSGVGRYGRHHSASPNIVRRSNANRSQMLRIRIVSIIVIGIVRTVPKTLTYSLS